MEYRSALQRHQNARNDQDLYFSFPHLSLGLNQVAPTRAHYEVNSPRSLTDKIRMT